MIFNKKYILSRVISLSLIFTFIFLNFSWAIPKTNDSNSYTLSAHTIFQTKDITPEVGPFFLNFSDILSEKLPNQLRDKFEHIQKTYYDNDEDKAREALIQWQQEYRAKNEIFSLGQILAEEMLLNTDENGKYKRTETGQYIIKPRKLCHLDGTWHRTVGIIVLDKQGQMLVQKRSLKKDNAPGALDVSAGGHMGESRDCVHVATEELEEEMFDKKHKIDQNRLVRLTTESTLVKNDAEQVETVKENATFFVYFMTDEEKGKISFQESELAFLSEEDRYKPIQELLDDYKNWKKFGQEDKDKPESERRYNNTYAIGFLFFDQETGALEELMSFIDDSEKREQRYHDPLEGALDKDVVVISDKGGTLIYQGENFTDIGAPMDEELINNIIRLLEQGQKFFILSGGGLSMNFEAAVDPLIKELKRRNKLELIINFRYYYYDGMGYAKWDAQGQIEKRYVGDRFFENYQKVISHSLIRAFFEVCNEDLNIEIADYIDELEASSTKEVAEGILSRFVDKHKERIKRVYIEIVADQRKMIFEFKYANAELNNRKFVQRVFDKTQQFLGQQDVKIPHMHYGKHYIDICKQGKLESFIALTEAFPGSLFVGIGDDLIDYEFLSTDLGEDEFVPYYVGNYEDDIPLEIRFETHTDENQFSHQRTSQILKRINSRVYVRQNDLGLSNESKRLLVAMADTYFDSDVSKTVEALLSWKAEYAQAFEAKILDKVKVEKEGQITLERLLKIKTEEVQEDAIEYFRVLDSQGKYTGEIKPRDLCHLATKDTDFHRSVFMLIFDEKGKMIFARRSDKKPHAPGAIDISAGGHMALVDDPALDIEGQLRVTALQELQEEIFNTEQGDDPLTGYAANKKALIKISKIDGIRHCIQYKQAPIGWDNELTTLYAYIASAKDKERIDKVKENINLEMRRKGAVGGEVGEMYWQEPDVEFEKYRKLSPEDRQREYAGAFRSIYSNYMQNEEVAKKSKLQKIIERLLNEKKIAEAVAKLEKYETIDLAKILLLVNSIADFFFKQNIENVEYLNEYIKTVLTEELKNDPSFLNEVDLSQVRYINNMVVMPIVIGDKTIEIEIYTRSIAKNNDINVIYENKDYYVSFREKLEVSTQAELFSDIGNYENLLVVMDKDGTITAPNLPIDDDIVDNFVKLLEQGAMVNVITGGSFEASVDNVMVPVEEAIKKVDGYEEKGMFTRFKYYMLQGVSLCEWDAQGNRIGPKLTCEQFSEEQLLIFSKIKAEAFLQQINEEFDIELADIITRINEASNYEQVIRVFHEFIHTEDFTNEFGYLELVISDNINVLVEYVKEGKPHAKDNIKNIDFTKKVLEKERQLLREYAQNHESIRVLIDGEELFYDFCAPTCTVFTRIEKKEAVIQMVDGKEKVFVVGIGDGDNDFSFLSAADDDGFDYNQEHKKLGLFVGPTSVSHKPSIIQWQGKEGPQGTNEILTQVLEKWTGKIKREELVESFLNINPDNKEILDSQWIERISKAFVEEDDSLVPVTDGVDVLCSIIPRECFSQEAIEFIIQKRDEFLTLLGEDVKLFAGTQDSFHITLSVFEDIVPGLNDMDQLTEQEITKIRDVFVRELSRVGAFELKLKGFMITDRGQFSAVWQDNEKVIQLRNSIFEACKRAGIRESVLQQTRPKLFVHTSLIRILQDIDKQTYSRIKDSLGAFEDVLDSNIKIQVDTMYLIRGKGVSWLEPNKYEIEEKVVFKTEAALRRNNRRDIICDLINELYINLSKKPFIIKSADSTRKLRSAIDYIKAQVALEKNVLNEDISQKLQTLVDLQSFLETDSIMSSLIILARQAKRQQKRKVFAFETDWIPRYKIGTLEHQLANPIIQRIESLKDVLKTLGIDNIEFMHSDSETLADNISAYIDEKGIDESDVIVLAKNIVLNSPEFNRYNGKALMAKVDTSKMDKFYTQNTGEILTAHIMGMFSILLEAATGKEQLFADKVSVYGMEYKFDMQKRIIFFIPDATAANYSEQQTIRDGYVQSLQAA